MSVDIGNTVQRYFYKVKKNLQTGSSSYFNQAIVLTGINCLDTILSLKVCFIYICISRFDRYKWSLITRE